MSLSTITEHLDICLIASFIQHDGAEHRDDSLDGDQYLLPSHVQMNISPCAGSGPRHDKLPTFVPHDHFSERVLVRVFRAGCSWQVLSGRGFLAGCLAAGVGVGFEALVWGRSFLCLSGVSCAGFVCSCIIEGASG